MKELRGHKNIVELLDLFKSKSDGSRIYMVFEYLEGRDLRNFYRERYRDGMDLDMVFSFAE